MHTQNDELCFAVKKKGEIGARKINEEGAALISRIFARTENRMPQVGDLLLINERLYKGGCGSRDYGGKYRTDLLRRYFGRVAEVYPHIIVLDTPRGYVAEKVTDFKVGLIQFVKVKEIPTEEISYEDKEFTNFAHAFERLLDMEQ